MTDERKYVEKHFWPMPTKVLHSNARQAERRLKELGGVPTLLLYKKKCEP